MPGGARLPTVMLTGAAELAYVHALTAAIRAARLNTSYPPGAHLLAHLHGLSPAVHLGLYPGLALDARSGLPTYREWTRVRTDAALAARGLAELPSRAELEARAASRPGSIHGKRLLKQRYYAALAAAPLPPLEAIDVALRRLDAKAASAEVLVTLDKLDATGALLRVRVELTERGGFWRRKLVAVQADLAAHTEELKAIVYQNAGIDAELLFAQLAARPGVTVAQVSRGTIGPIFCAGVRAPAALAELVASGGVVASFALDTAGVGVARDVDQDPLLDPMADALSAEARATYLEARARLGYKVVKERKFATDSTRVEAVRAFCRACKTRNPVYATSATEREPS